MKIHIPRMIVGSLLLGMAGIMLVLLIAVPVTHAPFARLVLLLTTTFVELSGNADISTGDWRPLNLCREPFGFGEPLAVLLEGCTENDSGYADKALALWEISSLPRSGH